MIVRTYLPYYCRTRPTSHRPKPFLTDKPTIPAKRFCVTLTAYFMYVNLKPVQKDATLLDVTCCVRLHTLLHVGGSRCAKFETSQTLAPATPNIYFRSVIAEAVVPFVNGRCHL